MGMIMMEKEKEISTMEEEKEEEYSEYSDDDMDGSSEEGESEEDVIYDLLEEDCGLKYELQDGRTITRPKVATRFYFRSDDCFPLRHELYDNQFPLTTFAKFAIGRYNHIERTDYEYVGLVKAYSRALAGFRIYIRFKACLHGQDAIDFQAIVFHGLRHKRTNVVWVDVESVYPLSTPVMPVNLLTKKVSSALVY